MSHKSYIFLILSHDFLINLKYEFLGQPEIQQAHSGIRSGVLPYLVFSTHEEAIFLRRYIYINISFIQTGLFIQTKGTITLSTVMSSRWTEILCLFLGFSLFHILLQEILHYLPYISLALKLLVNYAQTGYIVASWNCSTLLPTFFIVMLIVLCSTFLLLAWNSKSIVTIVDKVIN